MGRIDLDKSNKIIRIIEPITARQFMLYINVILDDGDLDEWVITNQPQVQKF
jgi:hypothetical protein